MECNHPVLYSERGHLSIVQSKAWNGAAVCLRASWQDFRAWRMEIRSAIGSGWLLPGGVIGVFCLPLITLLAQFSQFHVYLQSSQFHCHLHGSEDIVLSMTACVTLLLDKSDFKCMQLSSCMFYPFPFFMNLSLYCTVHVLSRDNV